MTTIGTGSLVGSPVPRVEDPDLLRGLGTFVDNLHIDGILHLAFVRSPFAHARVLDIDADAARAMPGVVAVYTAGHLELPSFYLMAQLHPGVVRSPLACERVRFVGDPVAVVVAETTSQAVDAAELVEVDYEPLPAVVSPESALDPEAPVLFENVGSNIVLGTRESGDGDALADAEVVVRGRFRNQRVAVAPMEASAIAVVPGDLGPSASGEHDLTVYLSCQMPHWMRNTLAEWFGLDPARIRLIAPHVGGSFGAKHITVEGVVAVKVALELGRPVKWVEMRSESMVAMPHGRGQLQYVELGLKRDGTIVGMRCRMLADAGAYAGIGGALVMMTTKPMAQGVYRIPRIEFDFAVVVTNTTPMGAYRGAGRPEATAFLERIIDMAAMELELDPAELRRKNLISRDSFPFTTATGVTYDSGDYEAALAEALRLADYDALRAEQQARRERADPVQLGIGLSAYVEVTGGQGTGEFAAINVDADGSATVAVGTSAHGQGHATAFSMIVADKLGMPLESIRYVQSDTGLVPRGGGTGGSRSAQVGGSVVFEAAEILLDRAKHLAADLLEAAPEDITAVAGGLAVAGVPSQAVEWSELARAANDRGEPLAVTHDFAFPGPTYPFGAQVAVVEVDTETGLVVPVRHVAVDDCGRILNPLIVEGQVHGGLASGVAQALWEEYRYDDDGTPVTTTLADYAMPSAAELPSFETAHTVTPSPVNPLGVKGIGESATVGATPAVQNAVVDALSHLGVRHIDMPCTPENVWRAICDVRTGALADPWRDPPAAFASLPVAKPRAEAEAVRAL